MTTTTDKPSLTASVPLWAWVLIAVGTLVVAIVVAGFVGYSISQSQPSDADLYARAQAGDREASETLEAKYAEPAPISSEKSGFIPGIYAVGSTEHLLRNINGGTVVAFFVYSAILGDEKAMDVVKRSDRGSLSSLFNQLRDMPRDYDLVHLLFEASELRDSDDNVVEETVVLNRKYTTEIVFFFPYMDEETLSRTFQPPSIVFELTRNDRGEWEITGAK